MPRPVVSIAKFDGVSVRKTRRIEKCVSKLLETLNVLTGGYKVIFTAQVLEFNDEDFPSSDFHLNNTKKVMEKMDSVAEELRKEISKLSYKLSSNIAANNVAVKNLLTNKNFLMSDTVDVGTSTINLRRSVSVPDKEQIPVLQQIDVPRQLVSEDELIHLRQSVSVLNSEELMSVSQRSDVPQHLEPEVVMYHCSGDSVIPNDLTESSSVIPELPTAASDRLVECDNVPPVTSELSVSVAQEAIDWLAECDELSDEDRFESANSQLIEDTSVEAEPFNLFKKFKKFFFRDNSSRATSDTNSFSYSGEEKDDDNNRHQHQHHQLPGQLNAYEQYVADRRREVEMRNKIERDSWEEWRRRRDQRRSDLTDRYIRSLDNARRGWG